MRFIPATFPLTGALLLAASCGLGVQGLGAGPLSDAGGGGDATAAVDGPASGDSSSSSSSSSSGGGSGSGSGGSSGGVPYDAGADVSGDASGHVDAEPDVVVEDAPPDTGGSNPDGGGPCQSATDCPPGHACNGGTCSNSCSASATCNGGCCSSGTCVADCSGAPEGATCTAGMCGCTSGSDCGNSSWGGNCQSGTCGCSLACFCCPFGTTCIGGGPHCQ